MQAEFNDTEGLIFGLCYCLFMQVLAFVFLKFPPKKINSLYGYRTARSMKNKEIWEAANTFWTSTFVKLNAYSFIVPFIAYVTFPSFNAIITMTASTIILIATMPITEKYLAKNFDKHGNRF